MDGGGANRAQGGMEPFAITRKKLTQEGGKTVVAPDGAPSGEKVWTGFAAFVPGDLDTTRRGVDQVRISFTADVVPAEGGAWVLAGFSDLEKIVRKMRSHQ